MWNHQIKLYLPIMKKLPGKTCSDKLLYDRSSTSSTGNAPNPRGNWFSRLIDTLSMRSFGIDDNDTGKSTIWLLDKFNISKLMRFAMPGGTLANLLWLNVTRVTWIMFTVGRRGQKKMLPINFPPMMVGIFCVGAIDQMFLFCYAYLHSPGISSKVTIFFSTRSSSRASLASSKYFFAFDILLFTGRHDTGPWFIFAFRRRRQRIR